MLSWGHLANFCFCSGADSEKSRQQNETRDYK